MKRVSFVLLTLLLSLALIACGSDGATTAGGDTSGGGDTSVPSGCTDDDGDGFGRGTDCTTNQDCDDANPAIFPGAQETCGNGVDEDCDGADLTCSEKDCTDLDDDGYGDGADCQDKDCDDYNGGVHPGAVEICGNGVDEDCDGQDDACPAVCVDEDNDGYGDGASCKGPDCDDYNGAIHPGAQEVCGDGKDQDCDGADTACPENCVDNDGDGYGEGADCAGIDCNDGDPDVHPGAEEICGNGKDDDCMLGDEECPVQCADKDGDNFGEGPDCMGEDCNDYDADVNPNAAEICGDGKDQNCDGVDAACQDECVDMDQDEFGTGTDCAVQDCDDTDATIFPGAEEACDNDKDDDCDGSTDEGCTSCVDADGDGYGEGADCDGTDCNDNDPAVNPGATEICGNGKDDDCVGGDEECVGDCVDADGDGAGVGADCATVDCDDANPGVHPAADEICGNGADEDCDGADAECPPEPCNTDSDCDTNQICDHATDSCRYAMVWEWWAPTIYQDTDNGNPGEDLFTAVDFDGEFTTANAKENMGQAKPAVVYYSFVKTPTHWYLGYYLYHPWRYSALWGSAGTQYENSMKGILLVVERDESMYGKLRLMETMVEDTFFQYMPSVSSISGSASEDGTIHYDNTGHHPIVYVHEGDHAIYGDSYWANNVSQWEVNGFPEDTGVVYEWGNVAETPNSDNQAGVYYEVRSLKDELWSRREDIGPSVEPFDEFGHFNSDEGYQVASRAPWRFRDTNWTSRPHGEFLYDPADFVRAHFANGWGTFSYEYVYNPYAVRVDIEDLFVDDPDSFDGFGAGEADPYFILTMYDGSGQAITVLDIYYGQQNNWSGVNLEAADYPLSMTTEMGRNYFFGIIHPDHDYFGIALKDDDAGVTGPDWMMEAEETQYYSFLDTWKKLDWGWSDSYVSVYFPGVKAD
jgi:hypothetical protein